MAGLGFLWGEAAQQTATTMQDWQKIFDARQAEQDAKEIQERQLRQQQRQLDWEKQSQKMQQDFQAGQTDQVEAERFGATTIGLMKDQPPDVQRGLYQALRDSGNMYAGAAKALVSSGLSLSPQSVFDYLNGMTNAEPGKAFDTDYTRLVAQQAATLMGKTGKDADAYVQDYVDLANSLKDTKGTVDQAKLDNLRLSNANLQSTISQQDAQTKSITAEMQERATRLGMDVEKHPLELQLLEDNDKQLQLQNVQQEIINGHLPDQLVANLNQVRAATQNDRDAHELWARTIDDTVAKIHAETGISESDARVALLTESTRVALAQGNVDQVRANVDYIKAQTETEKYRQDLLQGQTNELALSMQSTQVGILQDLVTNGDTALLGEFAPDLLVGLVGEDRRGEVIDDLKEIADSNRSNAQKLGDANARIAVANADYSEQTLTDRVRQQAAQARGADDQAAVLRMQRETFMEDRAWKHDLDLRGMAVNEKQAQAYVANLSTPSNATPGMTTVEVMDKVGNATGWTTSKIDAARQNLAGLQATYQQVTDAAKSGNLALVSNLLSQYGINAETAQAGLDALQIQIDTQKQGIVNGIRQIIDGGMRYNVFMSPDAMGLADDDPFYHQALSTLPFVSDPDVDATGQTNLTDDTTPTPEQASTLANIKSDVQAVATSSTPDAAIFNAVGTREALVDKYGEDAVVAAGINSPTDLVPIIQQESATYHHNLDVATKYMEHYHLDVNNSTDRDNAIGGISAIVDYLDTHLQNYTLLAAADRPPYEAKVKVADELQQALSGLGVSRDELMNRGLIAGQVTTDRLDIAAGILQQKKQEYIDTQTAIQYLNGR